MKYLFTYNFPKAKVVTVIGDFNNWSNSKNIMKKNEQGIWETEIDFSPGEYRYKFLIDNIIRMNDPTNNIYIQDEKGELTTLLIINEHGELMENIHPSKVHIENYHLTNRINDNISIQDKKTFNLYDEKIVCRLDFLDVIGVHNVSILWYRPDGEFYYMTENLLWAQDEDKGKPIVQWYWINAHNDLPRGKWTLKLYINGTFIFADNFVFQPTGYYMQNGIVSSR